MKELKKISKTKNMNIEQKQKIQKQAIDYILSKGKGYSQEDFSKDTKISTTILSKILNGKFTYELRDKKTGKIKQGDYGDKHFKAIANFLNINLSEKVTWRTFETEHYLEAMDVFFTAKNQSMVKSLIGSTGLGKTYVINEFKRNRPKDTYVITCANDFTVRDFVMEIGEIVGINIDSKSQARVRKLVQEKLIKDFMQGAKPLLIFDELENLKLPALGRIKALYDNLKGYCGFVFVGTKDWYETLKKWSKKSKSTAPQIFSRFVSRKTVTLSDSVDYEIIFKQINITEPKLKEAIKKDCTNYRDLADCLHELLNEANEMACEINYELYKAMYFFN